MNNNRVDYDYNMHRFSYTAFLKATRKYEPKEKSIFDTAYIAFKSNPLDLDTDLKIEFTNEGEYSMTADFSATYPHIKNCICMDILSEYFQKRFLKFGVIKELENEYVFSKYYINRRFLSKNYMNIEIGSFEREGKTIYHLSISGIFIFFTNKQSTLGTNLKRILWSLPKEKRNEAKLYISVNTPWVTEYLIEGN